MKKLILAGMCAGLGALASEAYAHGGQYRGPGDVVPPAPGGSGGRTPGAAGPTTGGPGGPTTPGPAGPTTPGPAGPTSGGPAGPAGPRGPQTGGGIAIGDDLTQWQFWWEFNKDPFIRLREAIDTGNVTSGSDDFFMGLGASKGKGKDSMLPTEKDILQNVLPKLKEALDATDQRDIVSSILVAMGKIGKNKGDEIKILELMKSRLTEKDQEVRETAALAMGIAALDDGAADLIEIVKDSPKGRELTDRSNVDDRTRTFSAYGLGLIAHRTKNADIKKKALECLASELKRKENAVSRNIMVGLINAIGLINPDCHEQPELAQACIEALKGYYMQNLGTGEQMVQSHVPPAVAKILGESGPDGWWKDAREEWKELLAAELLGKGKLKRRNNDIFRSAALTLGQLCDPVEDKKSPDNKYMQMLLQYYKNGRDLQARYFSLMAIGQMGGNQARNELMIALNKGNKSLEKPWAAVALGVYNFNRFEAAKKSGGSASPDQEMGRMIQRLLVDVKNPQAQGGFAVALGLSKFKDAADTMRELLIKNFHKEEMAGYLCIGLALMDDRRSVEDIRAIVAKSVRRPDLLQQAAIALGKLGDKEVADQLQRMMKEGDQNLAKMSAIASALGFIGDRRSIVPLTDMLFDENLTDLTRAFAAVALGGVSDKEFLPWNSKIGINMNYRAAVETLTNGSVGILDIL